MVQYTTSPVTTWRAENWSMTSKQGHSYEMYISIPKQPTPPTGYPVIYVLDGNAFFHTFQEAVKVQSVRSQKTGIVPMVVVGIGYPVEEAFASSYRMYDFTPPTKISDLPAKPDGNKWPENGGAEEFMMFINQELKPAVEEHVSINREKQTLFGHSLGGLFALQVLFSRMNSFQSFFITSPSIWWNNRSIIDQEKEWLDGINDTENLRLFMAVGELEKDHMINDARNFSGRLKQIEGKGISSVYYEVEEENHVSVVPTVLSKAMRFIGQ
ncbi:alpha/beta hydrolase [Virgibacillus salexigens]|uniref:alpha/beta hydrolase n=1 Tax=Virgibacillus salexigens TaxID=61016 RepID=UPI003081EDC4